MHFCKTTRNTQKELCPRRSALRRKGLHQINGSKILPGHAKLVNFSSGAEQNTGRLSAAVDVSNGFM